MKMHKVTPQNTDQLVPAGRKMLLTIVLSLMFFAMFGVAGTLSWVNGWILWGVGAASSWTAYRYLVRVNPEVIAARSRRHAGTKTWDKWIVGIFAPLFVALFLLGPLDTQRWHFWPLPEWLVLPGVLLFVAGFSLVTWAEGVNKFFEPTVRIQTDRGHYVVTTGPYAFVRHPGYIGMIIFMTGSALVLGSGLALLGVGIIAIVFLVRTVLEDRTLSNELPGYREYTIKVRYRLIPGIW